MRHKHYLWLLLMLSHLSRVRLCDPMNLSSQASLSITNSQSPSKPMSIELVMLSNHPILCCPLLLLPPISPSIRVLSNESSPRMRWPKKEFQLWHHSFQSNPRANLLQNGLVGSPCSPRDSQESVFSNTKVQKHQFFSAQPSSQSNSHIHDHRKNHSLD